MRQSKSSLHQRYIIDITMNLASNHIYTLHAMKSVNYQFLSHTCFNFNDIDLSLPLLFIYLLKYYYSHIVYYY